MPEENKNLNPMQNPESAPTEKVPLFELLNKDAAKDAGQTGGTGVKLESDSAVSIVPTAVTPPATSAAPAVFGNLMTNQPQALKPVSSQRIESLLGPRPMFAKADNSGEILMRKIGGTLLVLGIVAAIGVFGFFRSQLDVNFTWLNEWLGANTAQRFETSNEELKNTQTKLNVVRFKFARILLDDVNMLIDPYNRQAEIFNSDSATKGQKDKAAEQMQALGTKIKEILASVQKIFAEPLGVETYTVAEVTPEQREAEFSAILTSELSAQRGALAADAKTDTAELRIYDNVIRLVENAKFRKIIVAQDFAKITDEQFTNLLMRIREEGTDELSLIDKLRSRRLNWAQVIDDIHAVARTTDNVYGTGLFKTLGGFLFSSYKFDAKSGRIGISGSTKTFDSKTFSYIAKLVDAIEKSVKFKDIDFRSFSKNKDEGGAYSSSVNLEFSLQDPKVVDPRDEVIQLSTK
jgi:hypothetical protein